MPHVTVVYGDRTKQIDVAPESPLGDAIIATGLPLEQPCAGRGTCGKCKVLAEGALAPPDEAERRQLSPAELGAGCRLACRAQVLGHVSVTLAPIVVYSNKIFRACDVDLRHDAALGLAIDLGSTTVAALLTRLDDGRVAAGAAALNQQTVFGADVISRLAAAQEGQAARLSALARASIIQAVDALGLSRRARTRVRRVTIVGNCAMHHLLLGYPVGSLAALPFQPYRTGAVRAADGLLPGLFPSDAEVDLPPLIGGFVGSDALACLAYFGFDRASGPMAAIDLGTNGEVMVTDGSRILVASTAAGPAFEGVNISCGTRAVDGAIVGVRAGAEGSLELSTIGEAPPTGLTGSGLLSLVYELRRLGVVEASGRIAADHATFGQRLGRDGEGVRRFALDGDELALTQHDVRELQKAKGAIRAAIDILLDRLHLPAARLERVLLTGSFGSQVDVEAVLGLGLVPPLPPERIETVANGAGLGAALFLDEAHFARGERIAARAEQIDLDDDGEFNRRYVEAMALGEPR
jgi:uncharacterized 2Fe-2S/4Fe-4S cluster protein (DUF4445 family)